MSNLVKFLEKFEGVSTDPLKGMLELTGISKNPTVQFAIALISIYASVAVIKTIHIEADFPVKSILIMLFLMMIIFVFSALTKTRDKVIRFAGYILMFTVVLSTSFLTVASVSAIVFGKPERLAQHLSKTLDIEELVKEPIDCDLPLDQRHIDCIFRQGTES